MCAVKIENVSVAAMVERALAFAAKKVRVHGGEQVLTALQEGDCSLCEAVRYGMAREVAEYLGTVDHTVKAIYIYDPDHAAAVDEPVSTPGINLIAWVERKSAALTSVVGLLTSGLAGECPQLTCPKVDALCWALDVRVVDDAEVKSRTGYGALLSSLYVRPMEIWHR